MTRAARNADCRSQPAFFTANVFLAMRLLRDNTPRRTSICRKSDMWRPKWDKRSELAVKLLLPRIRSQGKTGIQSVAAALKSKPIRQEGSHPLGSPKR